MEKHKIKLSECEIRVAIRDYVQKVCPEVPAWEIMGPIAPTQHPDDGRLDSCTMEFWVDKEFDNDK